MGRGYMGKVLHVDLTTGAIEPEELPDSVYEQYLGGYGLGARILFDRIPAGADPLGPDNILGFVPGLLTGTGALCSAVAGWWSGSLPSPAAGATPTAAATWGRSSRRAASTESSCAASLVEARLPADRPRQDRAARREPPVGTDAVETEAALKEELGSPHYRVATIGQSGEKLSLISGIVNDRGRLAARSGLGAVMGSKKLKALVVRGHERVAGARFQGGEEAQQGFPRANGAGGEDELDHEHG